MEDMVQKLMDEVEKIALQIVMLEPGDIPTMGDMLNQLEPLKKAFRELASEECRRLVEGLEGYLEKLIMAEKTDLSPLESGIGILQSVLRALARDEAIDAEQVSEILAALQDKEAAAEDGAAAASSATVDEDAKPLSDEDIDILRDFINESRENLESIEVNLIELEKAPDDKDTINTIFRPFHTIKGVSGFLDLKKINQLAHSTENLLDMARQQTCTVDRSFIDIILSSVDILRSLLQCAEDAAEQKGPIRDQDIDVGATIQRIEALTKKVVPSAPYRPVGEVLVAEGKIQPEDLTKALDMQKNQWPEKRLGEILLEEKKVSPDDLISALNNQRKSKRVEDLQVKVDTHKLDALVDLAGELVIAQSMIKEYTVAITATNQKLNQSLNQLNQIVSGIQKIAMSMRMVPIKTTFQKMVRLVRDLARNSGKEVQLEMSGEDTEIDRNVVDAIYEPMVHMIRNAVDHGLESPEDRRVREKDPKGRIQLRAYHKGGNIVIEIEDDGAGLDKERILRKAIDCGLTEKGTGLSDGEIYDFIFHPGFSTAQKITDVSGRGVGMDVVKKGIEKLRGRLDIRSQKGEGTLIIISLPLTLAIIEGMLVRVGEERYILPTMAIIESLRPSQQDCHTVEGKGEMIMVRGHLIPLMRLNRIFGVAGESEAPWEGLLVVVENKEHQMALLIDELLGKEEFVIKSLGESLKGINGLAGGAILGDGRVGLILDMAGLFELVLR